MTRLDHTRGSVDWSEMIVRALEAGRISFCTHVPDESTGPLLDGLRDLHGVQMHGVMREEEGVGVLAGAYLGGSRGVLIIQASGVGNLINALGSLCVPCNIPMLLLISERGGLHEFNPCQVPLGKSVPAILDSIGVQTFRLERLDEVDGMIAGAMRLAFSTQQPVALMLTTRLIGGKA